MSHPSARFLVPLLTTLVATASVLIAAPAPAHADTGCPTPDQPSGTGADAQNAMQIATPAHLQFLRESTAIWSAGKFYELTADIAMPDGCTWTGGLGEVSFINTSGFSGSIDGNGHVVTGLRIEATTAPVGFIARYAAGSIEDFGVSGSIVATLSGNRNFEPFVGGLVGEASTSGTITRAFADVDIEATAVVNEGCESIGGIDYCSASIGGAYGGLIGYSYGPTVSEVYARGDVKTILSAIETRSTSNAMPNIGGLMGMTYRQVSKAYATGLLSTEITTDANNMRLGGLVGYGALNAVPSSTQVVPNTYWDTETSGTATGVAIALPQNGSAGKTTTEMKQSSTYSNWSIATTYSASSTWIACSSVNNGYPALMAMQPVGTCSPPDITSASPSSGLATGGTELTISGTGLTGASSVTVGGAAATVVSNSATELVVTTPAGTVGSADVVVTTANGSDTLAGGFSYTSAPAPNGGSSGAGGGGSTSSGDAALQSSTQENMPRPTREVINPVAPSTPSQSGSASAFVDGNPTSSTVSRVGTTITVSTPSAGTSFFVAPPESTLVTGVPIRFGFSGGQPTTPVSVFVMSTPVLVATAMTDARGQVSGYITLPASLAAGAHTLVVSGYTADGRPTSAYLGIEVSAPAARSLVRARAYFAFDSTRLTRRTDAVLRTMVREAQGRNPLTTTVGAVRANGVTAKDRSLALARSKAVADRLRQLGMPGEIRIGPVLPTTLTDARARRVDITVTYSN